jgi:hypothetical protein
MKLTRVDGLPFTSAVLLYRQREIEIPFVLVDTGSASTVFSSDWGAKAGIIPEAEDTIRILRGIGGNELVFTRRLSCIKIGRMTLPDFEAEFGSMGYGFQINEISEWIICSRHGHRWTWPPYR